MYDGGKIVPGLIIFVGLMTFPLWYNSGNAGPAPKLEKPAGKTACVKDTHFMRTSHMVLLNQWRDTVLRDGDRTEVTAAGEKYEKSLMLGCMKCHSDKKKFCDECHQYAAVKPYCWDCHFPPKENL
ncbi:MAG: sulfate reduction electron transfer complex DsrMKJOP subunit DsrJ [Desulfobacterales bacterium]|nr:sulfate reduction electron transfer complex DsrMKJOP subunit DsrJ [Desulfobacterales bacterium]